MNKIRSIVFCCLATAIVSVASAQEPKVSGIDTSLFSKDVSAGDNFYMYANEKWLKETKIPGDKSNYGIFSVLDDETRVQVRALIESAANQKAKKDSPAQKVGDLYGSVLDVEARNAAGIKPIQSLLNDVNKIDSHKSVAATIGSLNVYGVGAPVAPYISVDAKKSDQYAAYLTQSGLTLPDRDYYLEDEERYKTLRAELKTFIADMLKFVDHENPEKAAQAIFELEKSIAKVHWTKTENRDPVKTYNKHTVNEVDEMAGGLSWFAMAETVGMGEVKEVIVRQPSFVRAFGKMFNDVPVQTWKDYLTFRVINSYAGSLSEEIETRHFAFHGTAVSGVTQQEPMWKRGVNVSGSILGELVGQIYVDKHFKPAAKQRMNELVENLKRAFAGRIDTRDWMGEGTKKQALEKLGKFTTKIGYPDKWKDYTKLQIGSDDVLATNMLAASYFEHHRELDKLGAPIDRSEWHMTPQTINAYYNPVMNEIVFPAAILQPPFFNMAADDAVNYGAIGAVIGHELSHGFDDKGSKYDGNGNLRNWWTTKDREEFEKRSNALVGQYNEFEPVKENFVNGKLTLGENIGDLGGLNVAYKAYKLSLEGKPAATIDGLSGDQRFFLGWAQVWRRLYLEKELLRRLIVDPHSPSEYRANGIVRNMDEWYEAFGIKPDAKLYLAPEDRVRIW